jgi:hypothetical protein
MTTEITLPTEFQDLEPYMADWALETETQRMHKRFSTDMKTITDYYNIMIERIDAILDHLDEFDIDALPAPQQLLMQMTLSLVEVANAVEVYGRPASPHSCGPDRFQSRVVDLETIIG